MSHPADFAKRDRSSSTEKLGEALRGALGGVELDGALESLVGVDDAVDQIAVADLTVDQLTGNGDDLMDDDEPDQYCWGQNLKGSPIGCAPGFQTGARRPRGPSACACSRQPARDAHSSHAMKRRQGALQEQVLHRLPKVHHDPARAAEGPDAAAFKPP